MSGKSPDEIFCESCGEAIKKMAEVCPHCGVRNGAPTGAAGGGTVGSATSTSSDPHNDGIFEFSLKYPLSNDLGPIVIGGLLTLLFWLLIPLVMLMGYGYRVGRSAARGDDQIPAFDDWGALFMNGLLGIVVFLPFSVAIVLLVGALYGIGIQLEPGGALYGLWLVGGLVYLLATYVSGAILPTFIATGSVTDTYSDLRFLKVAFTKQYLVGFLVLLVISTIAYMVLSVVGTILIFTFVGIILLIPLYLAYYPFSIYMTMALWGYVCWNNAGEGPFPHVGPQDSLDAEF